MIIQMTGTLVNQVTLDASLADYTAYGGDEQLASDLSTALDIAASSIEVVSAVEAADGESLVVTYEINIYSDDGTTADLVKAAQTAKYLA